MNNLQFFKKQIGILIGIMFITINFGYSQNCKIIPQSSTMSILGTSNVHDWEMKVTKIESEITINGSKQISAVNVKIPVTSIKSEHDTMDEKTYEAFNPQKNPSIVFHLTEVTETKITNADTEVILTGNLIMAGQTRKISFKSICKITKSGDYNLRASVPLKMTDFGMKPPTAMMGTMKTGNGVTVKFDVTFKAQ